MTSCVDRLTKVCQMQTRLNYVDLRYEGIGMESVNKHCAE